ncbi:hypothetical protein PG985_006422 [Apiospora marii]|uniref:F-box domain-containing protein n=1 Tax=Apiospora marii TaxID=335849 RepID=A0ABR1S7K2_9PEZI
MQYVLSTDGVDEMCEVMSMAPPSSRDASLLGLPEELRQMVFDYFISDQTTEERRPQTLENEASFHSSSLLNFCRASRRSCDIGARFLYRSICINGRNLAGFDRALEKKPELADHVQRFHYTNGTYNAFGVRNSGRSSTHVLFIVMRVLSRLKQLRLVSLCMSHNELHLLSGMLSSLATEKQWPSLEAFIFQSYEDPEETNALPRMVYIKLPNLLLDKDLDEILSAPLRCFSTLAKLENLRVDLEGLTRVTAEVGWLPKSLKEVEVVVACEVDFHRHWYVPNENTYEIRNGGNSFDWGEPRDTWLSLCFVKLSQSVCDGLLPELRSLAVDHELDLEDGELVAATKDSPQWQAYYEHHTELLGKDGISLSWKWTSERGAPHS